MLCGLNIISQNEALRMNCQVCGNQSGKYPLCKACNDKKNQGIVIKCYKCGNWHYKYSECPQPINTNDQLFIYEVKNSLITPTEQSFFVALKEIVPQGYMVFPQINLAAFIDRTDNVSFHNELFRNVDFLITDETYKPKIAVEINDLSHLDKERKERDEKVSNILEEAGIPLLKLWTSYGVNRDYIKKKIEELLVNAVVRKKHSMPKLVSNEVSSNNQPPIINNQSQSQPQQKKKKGCYIATCVYGSYDCPNVWTLRRFRDEYLDKSIFGRLFIKCYYATSPFLVKTFGKTKLFHRFWKKSLDKLVKRLNEKGFDNTKYEDKY